MNLQKLYELDLARLEIGEQLAEIPRRTGDKSKNESRSLRRERAQPLMQMTRFNVPRLRNEDR